MTHPADLTGDFAQTASGRKLKWPDFDRNDIHIFDIAHGLALQPRYAGQSLFPYSVAQHSVILTEICHPDDKPQALLHDCAEYILGDKIRPIKHHMPEYKHAEFEFKNLIYSKYGIKWDSRAISDLDFRLSLCEKGQVMMHDMDWNVSHPEGPVSVMIKEMDWTVVRHKFLKLFFLLFPDHRDEATEAFDMEIEFNNERLKRVQRG